MKDAIGWVSSFVLVLTISKQVYDQWRDGRSEGVSIWLFIGEIVSATGFAVYSWMLNNPVYMVANGMTWDCHVFQHEIYQMLVPELDRIIYNLITDLEQRGLLDKTLVVMMGEFGRTPMMASSAGRTPIRQGR